MDRSAGERVRGCRAWALVVLATVLAAGCSGGSADHSDGGDGGDGGGARDEAAPEPVVTGPLSSQVEDWWAYDRPAEYGSAVTPVEVEARDGTPLDCSLVRPAGADGRPAEGQFPGLVVEFTPYQTMRASFEAEAAWFAERGYNGLTCNIRGTGASGGTWQHAMSSQDGRDAHDLVEWLATQPFSDGRIGQFGESYGGQTSYGAAVERPEHLRAVAPLQPPGDLYDDVIYPGGIKTTEGGTIDWWPGIAQELSGGRIDPEAEYAANRDHPTYDDYWQDRGIAGRVDAIDVPVLTMGGWEDGFFRSGTLADIEGALDRTWAIYGPWAHASPIRFPGCPTCQTTGLAPGVLLAWFDRWVMELDDVPVPDEPTFLSYEGPAGVGAGWRELSHWDPEGTDPLTLVLGADTLAVEAEAGEPGSVTFSQPAVLTDPGGAATFTTAPLTEDQVLLGRPTLELEATFDGDDANVYAELLDVASDGTTTLVNDGFLRASHRSSHTEPSPVTPGEATSLTVPIRADHHRFRAGHRVALRLSGGAADTLTPNPTPVEVTITTGGPSTLTLPNLTGL